MLKRLFVFPLVVGLFSMGSVAATDNDQRIRVTFLSPVEEGKPFWQEFELAMQIAATQLNIDLHIERLIYEEHNRFSVYDRYRKVATAKNKPDYFISFLQRKIELKTLVLFEQSKLNFVSVNTGLPVSGRRELGLPRQKFKHWIGHVSPNDFEAGRVLMHTLFNSRRSDADSLPLRVLAYSGPSQSEVANQRVSGLLEAIREINYDRQRVELLQALPTPWRGEIIGKKTMALIRRHGIPDLIWTPSDVIALGVIEAIPARKRTFSVGSFDWSQQGLEQTEKGVITANMGGHFMDGAWGLVMAYDHFHKETLNQEESGVFNTEMLAIDQNNVAVFKAWLDNQKWQDIDFKQYSKRHNPDAAAVGYRFVFPTP